MDNNDFDINFDYNSDDDFDPKAFLDADAFEGDIDLDAFSDEELGLPAEGSDADLPEDAADAGDDDFDLELMRFAREEAAYDEAPAEEFDPSDEDDASEYLLPDDENGEDPSETQPEDKPRKSRRSKKEKVAIKVKLPKLPKVAAPNIFSKIYGLYFAPLTDKEMQYIPADPDKNRRRRKKSRSQIIKEIYLPPILACLCLVMVMVFIIGSASNAIERKRTEADIKQSHLDSSVSQAQLEQERKAQLLAQAEQLAVVYNYDQAVTTLQSIGDLTAHPDVSAKISEYVNAQAQLTEYKDASMIPNLSFHVLIEDPVRAFKDTEFGGQYNRNFVTTGEFKQILTQLYQNGYVLVDFNSFTASQMDASGAEIFMPKSIFLPAGKKPIMITETMVNYFNYMVDGNGDNVADGNGDGFANKLVVSNGEIKAKYIEASGQELIGDYDLVPILETFIKEHPDFSYRGARATLAVTGYEGIFGYRITSEYIATKGRDFVDQEIADAKVLVQALRDKGYTLGCYTYKNEAYGGLSVAQITADLQSWTSQITPVIGNVKVFVFARTSSISDYSGNAFQAIYDAGFRYLVAHGKTPSAEINTTYVRQNRLMVTGNSMAWSDNFKGIFDPVAVLDLSNRGNVPN